MYPMKDQLTIKKQAPDSDSLHGFGPGYNPPFPTTGNSSSIKSSKGSISSLDGDGSIKKSSSPHPEGEHGGSVIISSNGSLHIKTNGSTAT